MLTTIKTQLKDAMFKKDKTRVSALRNIIAKAQMKKIEKNDELTDGELQKVLQSMAKQLKDSIEQYSNGGRNDLAQKESKELDIINEFLPKQMTEVEISEIIINVIDELGATTMKDMGKVMGLVISRTSGRADGSIISKIVKEKLS